MNETEQKIASLKSYSARVMDYSPENSNIVVFDFSDKNKELLHFDISNTAVFSVYVREKLDHTGVAFGLGKYNEDRSIYKRSRHFDGAEAPRTVHLGVDIWSFEHQNVYAPLDAKVHSFGNNDNFGDYGATIILEHQTNNFTFYTLYGHLSLESLKNCHEGQNISKGEHFAKLGQEFENGHWPPHLHFQLITNMYDYKGDFPGVVTLKEREKYLGICPDPNLLLDFKVLNNAC